ncbi:hypothetical protein LPJ66_002049 [Kickxella alabastrina]|uniref:Uncharacterized protein n=1 Tax=Kickxella alabastrina TaxID=61397 RepID=A0ACC1IRH0_9FUNG|nr:hypothetical protein LPJ66_002049 [Kickxella alabastrina]
MHNVNLINSLIRKCIFDKLVGPRATNLVEWAAQLRLLGVCTQWTRELQSLIFQDVFLEFSEVDAKPGRENNAEADHSDSRRQIRLKTNVECVVSRGHCHSIQAIHISSHFYVPPRRFINDTLSALDFDHLEWPDVRSLNIANLRSHSEPVSYEFSEMAYDEPTELNFGEIIARQMPHISELRLDLYESLSSDFASTIFGLLARQLRVFACSTHLRQGLSGSCDNLTHLDIRLGLLANQLPLLRFSVSSLRFLSLHNVPMDFSLKSLVDSNGKRAAFTSLKTLYLSYSAVGGSALGDTMDNNGVALTQAVQNTPGLPVLDTLHILGCPLNCELLAADLENVKSFKISGDISNMRTSLGLRLGQMRHLSISLADIGDADDPDIYEITSNLLSKSASLEDAHLHFDCLVVPLGASKSNWTNWTSLTKLTINGAVCAVAILDLIDSLPNLLELAVALNYNAVDPEETTLGEQMWLMRVEPRPFESKLQVLGLTVTGFEQSPELNKHVHTYLLTSLPTLQVMYTNCDLQLYLETLIETKSSRYPHLSDVKLFFESYFSQHNL